MNKSFNLSVAVACLYVLLFPINAVSAIVPFYGVPFEILDVSTELQIWEGDPVNESTVVNIAGGNNSGSFTTDNIEYIYDTTLSADAASGLLEASIYTEHNLIAMPEGASSFASEFSVLMEVNGKFNAPIPEVVTGFVDVFYELEVEPSDPNLFMHEFFSSESAFFGESVSGVVDGNREPYVMLIDEYIPGDDVFFTATIVSSIDILYPLTLDCSYCIDNATGNFSVKMTSLIEPSAVPVPPSVWLFGSGLLGLVGIARRKKAA